MTANAEYKPRHFTVNVVGRLWNGQRGYTTYNITATQLPENAAVKHIAGDFASVIDYQLIETVMEYEDTEYVKKTIKTETTLRPWEDYDSEVYFLDNMGRVS